MQLAAILFCLSAVFSSILIVLTNFYVQLHAAQLVFFEGQGKVICIPVVVAVTPFCFYLVLLIIYIILYFLEV